MKLSLQDLKISGKKVLMRVDFNVPLDKEGKISDDSRIQKALPSIQYILSHGGALILMSHLGRPEGKKVPSLSLRPCAERLSELLNHKVTLAPDVIGSDVKKRADALKPGEVLLLENLRFYQGEESPAEEPLFTKELASLGEVYVNDAFGAAHRKHASVVGITTFFPQSSAMGFLMEKEISFLSQVALNPKRPFYAIIGGAKIGTKIGILEALAEKVDGIFIGGGMAFTFFKAEGLSIGDSICDDKELETARTFLKKCKTVHFPKDIVITDDREIKTIEAKEGLSSPWKGVDIGPQTVDAWTEELKDGATLFWNGPMGIFENPSFAKGTHYLAQNLSTLPGDVIVGGGDSVAAIHSLKLEKSFTHLSSGGGASLEFIEWGHLPGIDALTNKPPVI